MQKNKNRTKESNMALIKVRNMSSPFNKRVVILPSERWKYNDKDRAKVKTLWLPL